MPKAHSLAIHWFRRDLRIVDNSALHHAAKSAAGVIPVYVLSDWKGHHSWTGPNRQSFLCQSLESLHRNLETIGGSLVILSGNPVTKLEKLVKDTGADAVFYNQDPDPHGRETEQKLHTLARNLGIECRGFQDHVLHGPEEVLTQSDEPYRVFTPYRRNWSSQPKPPPLPKPSSLHTPSGIPSLDLPDLSHWKIGPPAPGVLDGGEKAAHARLKKALTLAATYKDLRDLPSADGTTRLSQDLRFGLISIRTLFAKLTKLAQRSPAASDGIETLISELAWRDFYMAILHHYPQVLDHELNPAWRGLPWDQPGETFEAWKQGLTGFPIIDAAMRELLTTGHMHNRLRMITAMFLTKDLHLDWRLGEQYFMQRLVDGEIASNNGGWQWSAGTGADAAPYFRIQNPWTQTKRYDPKGIYIKRWVPELAKTEPLLFHSPPADGHPIAPGYPLPIIDHKTERNRTLAIFKRHKEETQG